MKICLTIATIFLLITSTTIPMTIGYNVEPTERDELLEKFAFACPDRYGLSKLADCEDILQRNGVDANESKVNIVLPTTLPFSPPMDSAWPMYCHDARHTGRSPYVTIDTTNAEKWRFYSSGSVDGTPVIDNDGTIYFKGAYNHLDRYLFAIYPNGTEKWKYKTGGLIWGSSPAISDDGTIYVGSWDGKLYSLNLDGTEKWKFGAGAQIASSPAISDDGTIYFGIMGPGNKGRIYAVNPDGAEKWHYDTDYWIVSDPAIGDDGTVYIGSGDSYLYAIWSNGTLRWRFKTGNYVKGSPSIAEDGTIYIGSYDAYFYAVNPDGTEKWKFNSGGVADNCVALASDGTIYVGTDKLYARDPNGSKKWTFDLGTDGWIGLSSPAVSADGIVYIGTHIGDAGGEIIAVNPDGTERWCKKIAKQSVDSSPSIAEDGTVYIGSWYAISEGYLHAFGTVEDNEPPSAPSIIGETNGNTGDSYTYTFVSNDPENYPLKYYIEWGDNTSTGWTWEYDSGEEVEISHTWAEEGTYTIRAKSMDISNEESEWGYLEVTMPVNYNLNQHSSSSLFLQILQQIFQKE